MNKITKITIVILILCAAIVQAAVQDISVEVKARILYGNEPEQLKVSWQKGDSPYNLGVLEFAIDKEESIYIANIDGKVKKYSPSGTFVYETDGIINSFQSFTVNDEGEIIIRSESEGNLIEKFDIEGFRIWGKKFKDIVSKKQIEEAEKRFGIELGDFRGWITTGFDGSIVAELQCWAIPPSHNTLLRPAVHMTSDGDFTDIIPYFPSRTNDGWVYYESETDAGGRFTIAALTSKDMKTISKRVELDINVKKETPITGISAIYSDQYGGFWTIEYINSEPYYITSTIIKKSNLLLNHFDSDGKFTGEWVLSLSPFDAISLSNITVAPNGDVYHLQFDEEGVNVVAYRSPAYNSSSSGNASSLYGLSSRNIDGVLYTHLRSLVSESGYKVYWDKETKTTIISNREKKILISNGTAVVRTEELEKREPINTLALNGSNWISVDDAISVLSIPVQTDKTNRVAYLIK